MPGRHGKALRSQSRAAAGPVVGGLEAPGAHPSCGPRGVRKVRNAGPVRARPAQPSTAFSAAAFRAAPGPRLPCSSIPAWACTATFRTCPGLESRTCSGRPHRRAGVDRRRRRGLDGLAGRQERRQGAAGQVAGHARQLRELRCSSLSRSSPTRAACGLWLPTCHKPVLGRRSSTGRRWKKLDFRYRSQRTFLTRKVEMTGMTKMTSSRRPKKK